MGEGEEVVLERDLELRHVTSYPTGNGCFETSQLRVILPYRAQPLRGSDCPTDCDIAGYSP